MKFYEFNKTDFSFYSLIGAESEEEAKEFYENMIHTYNNKKLRPKIITKNEAKKKLLATCKTENDFAAAEEEFQIGMIEGNGPYLVLLDNTLF